MRSFNPWMRRITWILFGLGIACFGIPYLSEFFTDIAATIKIKFQRAKLELKIFTEPLISLHAFFKSNV